MHSKSSERRWRYTVCVCVWGGGGGGGCLQYHIHSFEGQIVFKAQGSTLKLFNTHKIR